MKEFLEFKASEPYTLGVELEFQLLDPRTQALTPAAQPILADLPADRRNRIKPEFITSMLEVATGVCADLAEVERDLRDSFELLERLAERHGCLLFAASLHPFSRYQEQVLSPGQRYADLMTELQMAGRRLITQGLHVHVGLSDGATTLDVFNRIRRWLPILLALSASSPFYGGEDTGFFSYRSRLMDALARAGMPRPFRDWRELETVLGLLQRAGAIRDIREIWWDVRPHPDFGTIEVRICDLPGRFGEILALAALIQALVKTLAETPSAAEDHPQEIIICNKWEAARHGLGGFFIEPAATAPYRSMVVACQELLDLARPASERLGTSRHLGTIEKLLQNGTSAARFRKLQRQGLDFPTIIEQLRKEFWS